MNQTIFLEGGTSPTSQCPRCQVHLVEGKAFAQPPSPVLEVTTDEDFTAKLVDCMKCPCCGYSELAADDTCGVSEKYMSALVRAHYAVFGRAGLLWDGSTGQYALDEKFGKR